MNGKIKYSFESETNLIVITSIRALFHATEGYVISGPHFLTNWNVVVMLVVRDTTISN